MHICNSTAASSLLESCFLSQSDGFPFILVAPLVSSIELLTVTDFSCEIMEESAVLAQIDISFPVLLYPLVNIKKDKWITSV